MNPPKERISKEKGWMMIGTAVLFDVIGLIPFVNIAADIAYLMLFPAWFYMLGASFVKKPSMLWWTIATSAVGFIPVISTFLPELTVGVVRNVLYVQREDRRAIAAYRKSQSNMVEQQNPNQPQQTENSPQPAAESRSVDGIRRAA